jgi:hypothetical protein
MPTPQLTLPQQFGRFLVAGALVFLLAFWITTSCAVTTTDAHRDLRALTMILKALTTRTFSAWLQNLHTAYLPFFLGQRPLVVCYLISAPLAWLAAFLYDMKILRKENIV